MIKIFETRKPYVYFILENTGNRVMVTKCRGYFMEGIFMGIEALERKESKFSNISTYEEILNKFFKKVGEQDVIGDMKIRLQNM